MKDSKFNKPYKPPRIKENKIKKGDDEYMGPMEFFDYLDGTNKPKDVPPDRP